MSKEIKSVEINELVQDWNTRVWSGQPRKVIDGKDIDEFKKWFENIQFSDFVVGKPTFFDKKVKFPRRKFQKGFSTNKLVGSAGDAEVVIIDKCLIKSEIDGIHQRIFYPCKQDNTYCYYAHCPEVLQSYKKTEFVSHYYSYRGKGDEINALIQRLNELYEIDGKIIVDITDLSLKSDEVLDVEAYDRLSKMLSGTDDNMKNMAIRLLTAYDYDREKYKIVLLLKEHWHNWQQVRNKKQSVETLSMFRKLSLDYPSYEYYSNEFWIKAALEYPDDPVVQRAFNHWIKTMYAKAPDVKIVKI